jgi:hypothetical protein
MEQQDRAGRQDKRRDERPSGGHPGGAQGVPPSPHQQHGRRSPGRQADGQQQHGGQRQQGHQEQRQRRHQPGDRTGARHQQQGFGGQTPRTDRGMQYGGEARHDKSPHHGGGDRTFGPAEPAGHQEDVRRSHQRGETGPRSQGRGGDRREGTPHSGSTRAAGQQGGVQQSAPGAVIDEQRSDRQTRTGGWGDRHRDYPKERGTTEEYGHGHRHGDEPEDWPLGRPPQQDRR